MRLTSFHWQGKDRLGVEVEGGVVDLHEAARHAAYEGDAPGDMLSLIERGDGGSDFLAAIADYLVTNQSKLSIIPTNEIEWHPPVRRPSKIIGVAMNNSASDARKISSPSHPLFFIKPASALVGHEQAIEARSYYGSVHPEPELAVVIGKKCRDVSVEDAMDVVFGYTIHNDMTGNDMRGQDMVHYYALYASQDNPEVLEQREQHLSYAARYKGTDNFAPMGPWLVTKDEIPDPHALEVRCWHKDELIAEDSTAFYTYSVAEVIAFLTRFHTLWPGDIISMGTAFRPGQGKRSLHTANITAMGGPLKVEITGLGTLFNPVIQKAEVAE